MLSLLTRAVVVSVHGHKQLSTAPIGIHLRSLQARDDDKAAELSSTILYTVNLALFIPVLLYVGYTLGTVIPTLASVEPSQGTYAPVPVHDDDGSEGKAGKVASKTAVPEAEEAGAIKRRPITSSIRATHKHLCSVSSSGWRSLYRGLVLAFITHLLTTLVASFFIVALPGIPPVVPVFLADVALVQLNTVWVHSVISLSTQPWWRRIPPFVETLKATILPLGARFLATAAASGLPTLILLALGRPMVKHEIFPDVEINNVQTEGGDGILYFGLWFALLVFAAVPAQVVVVRVQASLLPDTDETIVPFDRSLGRTTPQPSAYQRMVDALTSFSGCWQRYYMMTAKTIALSIAIAVALCAVLGAEVLVMSYFSSK